jgi:hydrogenase maturation protein HypF
MTELPHRFALIPAQSYQIRVRGRVQGVGFRPTLWRVAREIGLCGEVLNDAEGVLIRVAGPSEKITAFIRQIEREPPPLARIEAIEVEPYAGALPSAFVIAESFGGDSHTEVCPDAALCPKCAEEISDASSRRYRYPFTTCTHCGPRLTIVTGVPYDRNRTTMQPFELCNACGSEYNDPANRRFHAEAIACSACGPSARLIRFDGDPITPEPHPVPDKVDAAATLIRKGEIVAVKGLGGYQLACGATNGETVATLRQRKKRDAKPFALMARDLDVIRRFCSISPEEEQALTSPEAPIVLLSADGAERLAEGIAPGLATLGFMLPTTPLHALLLRQMSDPVVMTSGNLSDEPQVTCDGAARTRLASIATHALVHDRDIANRVDDSVVRFSAGKIRIIRRARGYAPSPIRLPKGFETALQLLAFGGELKAAFCLVKDGEAILSQHQGDLEDARTFDDYKKNLALYTALFVSEPANLVADRHPEYLSTKLAHDRALSGGSPLIEVQHHHAHVAACLAENGRPLSARPVLGIVLDGLGYGDGGEIWGGEFLLADYCDYQRLGTFKPVAMLGGAQAAREPWRNLYAHLMAAMDWPTFVRDFADIEVCRYLEAQPRKVLDAMLRDGTNSPKASSCGRLFDAFAAAIGICRDKQAYEGEAAARVEAIVDQDEPLAYPFAIRNLRGRALPYIEPHPAWNAILRDIAQKIPPGRMAARFHKGLGDAIGSMVTKLADAEGGGAPRFDTVALSGGCFQNKVLLEEVSRRLRGCGVTILTHSRVPANDGGLALGQAVIAAANLITKKNEESGGTFPCLSRLSES